MRIGFLILALFALAAPSPAADIDGKWTGETKIQAKAGERTVTLTLNLTTEGGLVKGTLEMGGRRARPAAIESGKLEGNRLTFSTTQTTRKGEQKANWVGTVTGSEMELSRQNARGRAAMTVKLKKQ